MTTAELQHAQPNRFRDGWRGFRRWRRARPFWGGLLTALAGLEIFGTAKVSLGGLSFQMGPTGFLSWLIPAILVTSGLLMWLSPQHRTFYAVVTVVTALFSLIAVNLGGFFLGLLLGTVGGALAFAWVPGAYRAARPGGSSADGGTLRDDSPRDQATRDEAAEDQTMRDEAADGQTTRDEAADDQTVRGEPTAGGSRDLRGPNTAAGAPIASSWRSSTS
ncbi:hypothetical protein GA0070624_3556 [Micromonospora rhizosphaerae]|uniref:Uncharacterized protein n=1 Tax=Micromonospora rhizosphaerae TaxID=568872 RepID=A0A1C6SE53_9ACTN|nr:DUF6114 domain-containing protein [Micromonospora rhizosphaerae]SCL27711.1 hypothetical protein GA0070624_3556 [Micromonospora rhizosphaerae]